MMERRGFLARLAAAVAALVVAPAVARASFDETPPVIDSHAEELAAFDRDLGICEDCHEQMGTTTVLVSELHAMAAPTIGLRRVCDQCAEIRRRSAAVYTDYNAGVYLAVGARKYRRVMHGVIEW